MICGGTAWFDGGLAAVEHDGWILVAAILLNILLYGGAIVRILVPASTLGICVKVFRLLIIVGVAGLPTNKFIFDIRRLAVTLSSSSLGFDQSMPRFLHGSCLKEQTFELFTVLLFLCYLRSCQEVTVSAFGVKYG